MKLKNNYNECITNFACSIRKYFNLEYKHNTLDYIDNILNEVKPKNVVTILCDGMGSKILSRTLDVNSFLMNHMLKEITTVFPATTVAATTSAMTGLNPVETCMLGWTMYYKDIDKTITTFMDSDKADFDYKPLEDAVQFKNKNMITKSIMEEINEKGENRGYTLFPFGANSYSDLDDMYKIIKEKCNEDGKKYIYAYDIEPDHTMHDLGSDSDEVKKIIININDRVEKLSKELNDTVIFVIADHGHITVENLFLKNYPEIYECLERTTSLESRAVNFFIKKDKIDIFEKLFNNRFSNDFDLLKKDDVIKMNLFGTGDENPKFRDCLGEFLAVAKTDKTLLNFDNEELKSQHAGYTDDEIYIPLIVVNTNDMKAFKLKKH